jgi:predicted enzyme related to lactoylglutathione lyase
MKSTYGTMYYVDNMAESVSFYKRSLGLTPTFESVDWTEFSVGGHNLCLHTKRPGENYRENGVLIFNAQNVKELFEKMKNDGLKVFGLRQIHAEAWSFHMHDQHNNEISFYGEA